MFKVAAISDEISQDLAVAAALVAEFGGQGLEIRSVWEKGPHELDRHEVMRIRDVAAEFGLRICGIASPVFKCHLGRADEEAQHCDILRRCIDLAHALDTRLIRVFTFWKEPGPPPWSMIADRFAEPLKLAERHDVVLGVENERSTMASESKRVAEFLALVQHPRLQAVWDPGNEVGAADGGVAFPDGYERLKPWIVHVQIKDVRRLPGGGVESVELGTGEVDYPGQLRALQRDNYQGYLSLETHWRPHRHLPQEIVRLPQGSAFSLGGEEATRRCMARLRAMLQQL